MPKHVKQPLVLAITPCPKGFGFAILDGRTLVDWGVKVVPNANHAKCLHKSEQLMARYQPDFLAMEDHKRCQRSGRICALMREIVEMALGRGMEAKLFVRAEIYRTLCTDGQKSKNALAEALVQKFPDELGFRVPRRRKAWTSEDHRMVMFDAVALGLMADGVE